jgi:AhpD family alkylhydroperoxidase
MEARLNPYKLFPSVMQGMIDLEGRVKDGGLEHSLLELIKMRVSQINGCAFCLHMHATDARQSGETENRLYLLSAWRESSYYTDRERAALGWAEALTLISQTNAPDADYAALKAQFSDKEQVVLTLAITTINAWNRIAIGFRSQHPHD